MASRRAPILLTLAALILLVGCGKSDPGTNAIVVGGDDDGLHGAVLTQPYRLTDLPLTDTDGSSYSLAKDADKALTLVFFGYTHCPDICQAVMSNISSALTRLDEQQRAEVDVAFVTTDPGRDDEAVLRSYLDRFDPGFIGLTGNLATIETIGKQMGVFVAKGQKLPDGGYEVDHSTQVIGLEKGGKANVVWTQGTSAQQLADDVVKLLAE